MTRTQDRRGFLRGLATLPLIGGSVALIGNPTAAATPITGGMVAQYLAWLHFEQRYVEHGAGCNGFTPHAVSSVAWQQPRGETVEAACSAALHRAPVILAAAGVPAPTEADEDWWLALGPPHWLEGVR